MASKPSAHALIHQPWLKFPCPKCGAAVGESCHIPFSTINSLWHKERWTSTIKGSVLSRRNRHDGRRYSSYCYNNQHEKCAGTCWMKGHHGVRMVCQCQCHGKVKAYVPPKPKKEVNPLESKLCQNGKHKDCSMVRRLPNKKYAPCECQCHENDIFNAN